MNKKPSLLILAAGMGSRYGGLKQMDAFGPNGETLLDYSIYDAIQEGFGKIVFVIRAHFADAFIKVFEKKLKDKAELHFVHQELDIIPGDYSYPADRVKPWGTGHAVWVAKNVIDEPFAVINADDYYGRHAYRGLADFFRQQDEDQTAHYALVGYELLRTLSAYGTVNRGVCKLDNEGYLAGIEECLKIGLDDGGMISYHDEAGVKNILEPQTTVSMNMWGFYPDYFDFFEKQFAEFLTGHGQELKSEFYIPMLIDFLIHSGRKKVEILHCAENWFGVTYKKDKPNVVEKINLLIQEGRYPEKLW